AALPSITPVIRPSLHPSVRPSVRLPVLSLHGAVCVHHVCVHLSLPLVMELWMITHLFFFLLASEERPSCLAWNEHTHTHTHTPHHTHTHTHTHSHSTTNQHKR